MKKNLVVLMLLVIGIRAFAQMPPAYIPTLGLVGWWPFNGNPNDESGSGNYGINVNATLTADRFGNANSAYLFNGTTSHIKIPNAFFNPGWNAFTLSFWLNCSSANNPNNPNNTQSMINTIPHNGIAVNRNWGNSNKYAVWANQNPPVGSWNIIYNGLSANTVTLNTWVNLALVKNGTTYNLYKDGVLDQTYNGATIANSYFCKMVFGSTDSLVATETFIGKLDDYGIWNRALTPTEITQVYLGCAPPATPGAISGNSAACAFSGGTYSIAAVAGAASYAWTSPAGWSGASNTNIINLIAGASGGSITVVASNSCGISPAQTIAITVNGLPSVNAFSTSSLLCNGSSATLTANGANTYTWLPGGTGFSIVITPTVTTNYTVTGTDPNGCVNNTVVTQNVSDCTGLPESQTMKADLLVFPNPTKGPVTFSLLNAPKGKVKVYNILGALIYETEVTKDKVEIDLSDSNSGIYIVKFITAAGSEIKKILKD